MLLRLAQLRRILGRESRDWEMEVCWWCLAEEELVGLKVFGYQLSTAKVRKKKYINSGLIFVLWCV